MITQRGLDDEFGEAGGYLVHLFSGSTNGTMKEGEPQPVCAQEIRQEIDRLIDEAGLEAPAAAAIRDVFNELQAGERNRVTKFELMLLELLRRPDRPTFMSELTPIFETREDAQGAVRRLVHQLNTKLDERGVRVERVNAYRFTSSR